MQKNVVVILLFAIVIALFAILNAGAVPINFIFAKANISAALVILISAALGAIIVYSFDAIALFKFKKKVKELEKSLLEAQAETDSHKSDLKDALGKIQKLEAAQKTETKIESQREE